MHSAPIDVATRHIEVRQRAPERVALHLIAPHRSNDRGAAEKTRRLYNGQSQHWMRPHLQQDAMPQSESVLDGLAESERTGVIESPVRSVQATPIEHATRDARDERNARRAWLEARE
jgi:hypothetical protein